ncbi:MAG: ATP-binding protein [Geothrix sp.]|nr:ATP-binding protein [Geothrix sp.]
MSSLPKRLPGAVLVGAWVLVAALHLILRPERRLLVWPLGYMLLEILAGASLAYRAWRTPGGERAAWWLLAGSAFLEVPNLILTLLGLQGSLSTGMAQLPSYLSLATGILVLAGILSFPRGRERGGRFRRRVLDALIFAASLLFLLWVMGIQGSFRAAAQGVGLRVFAAYLNVALLGGGLVFMTSYHPDRSKGPLGWLAASAGAWLAAISCWTLAGLPSVVATRPWIVLAGAIPLFQGLAAWSPRRVEESLVANPELRLGGLLPYVPVAVAVPVLAAMLAWSPRHATREAYAIFLAVVLLLLFRQVLAIEDLEGARRTLEDRVLERTRALERAQETLLRTERMNALALMGAGLAHDLNNLLGVIKNSAELAVMDLEEQGQAVTRDLARIATAADRAARLTGRLMGFVRRESEALSLMDVVREIREMESMLRLLLPRTVTLQMEFPVDSGVFVRSSKLRLEQMLVNLVANAGGAMPEGGRLTIHAGPGAPGTEETLIEVADSGTGMTTEVMERIFDPFFTTKPSGKGVGLGLPSLKAMVEADGGRLEVSSEPGRGSRFRIFLPRLLPDKPE